MTGNPAPPQASGPQRDELTVRHRGYLPHWEMPDGVYFVTFRLADSLPQEAFRRMLEERQRAIDALYQYSGNKPTPVELARVADAFSERVDSYLDMG